MQDMENNKTLTIEQATDKAERYCVKSEHCTSEVRTKLMDWGAQEAHIDSILTHLTDEKYIDHHRYSDIFVRDKFRFNGWGRQKIAYALKLKGIDSGTIQESLEQLENTGYEEKLIALLEQKKKGVKARSAYEMRSKLIQFALSRGFEMDCILKILQVE